MKDDMLREKFDDIEKSIDRLRQEVNPEIKLDAKVQHSLIWAIAIVVLALIIKWILS